MFKKIYRFVVSLLLCFIVFVLCSYVLKATDPVWPNKIDATLYAFALSFTAFANLMVLFNKAHNDLPWATFCCCAIPLAFIWTIESSTILSSLGWAIWGIICLGFFLMFVGNVRGKPIKVFNLQFGG